MVPMWGQTVTQRNGGNMPDIVPDQVVKELGFLLAFFKCELGESMAGASARACGPHYILTPRLPYL